MDTLGSMRASVVDWLRGARVSSDMVDGAINDAIESLFQTLTRASLSIFMGGPVNLTLSAGTDGAIIVSVADPTVAPTLSDVVSGALAQHAIVATYTYVTESGTETLISGTTTRTVPVNNVLSIASPAYASGALGWNAYVGSVSGRLVKQNEEPIEFGVAWQEDDTGYVNGPDEPGIPLENTTGDNIFYIRHMEVQTTSGALKTWTQADIDSDLMRRFGVMAASSSEYQNYAFDLLNQRQLEIRPALGATLTARYFWIVKPRRMRFSNSPLPFPTVPASEFIRQKALSDVFLGLREVQISNAWEAKAEKSRARCELAVTMINRPKNQKVTPYRC